MTSYDEHLHIAVEAAKSAGTIIQEQFGSSLQLQIKQNRRDIVTNVDLASESEIFRILKNRFPSIPFLSEETANSDISNDPLWVIDPLDGTSNFIRGIELFTIAIALCVEAVPVVAVVYNPISHKLYTAQKGRGAFLNDHRISISDVASLEESTITMNMSYNNKEREIILENIKHVLFKIDGLRMFFSSEHELCLVAEGSSDAAVMYETHPWDVAAGCLIIQEAGGRVSNWAGENWKLTDRHCLGSNGNIHQVLLSLLQL